MIRRYTRWLHTRWPAGIVERLPEVHEDFSTNVPGLYVVGDLAGVPLLKFAADSGVRAVRTIACDPAFKTGGDVDSQVLDLAIVGGGVSGCAAAMEAGKLGLRFELYEAAEPLATIANFPKGKPIFTYPTDMTPAGDLQFHAQSDVKERLLEDLRAQLARAGIEPRMARIEEVRRSRGLLELGLVDGQAVRARRVIVAIGRSGNFRKLGVPGEDLDKVYNRLHDPKDFSGRDVLVVGGGDSALESAISLATCGARVTLSYRKAEFSRPKPENVEKLRRLTLDATSDVQITNPVSERVTTASGAFMGRAQQAGSLRLMLASRVTEIRENDVAVHPAEGDPETIPNDAVLAMIGRDPPLGFFRRSGVRIRGEWRTSTWLSFALILIGFTFLYHWKKGDVFLPVYETFAENNWFPLNVPDWWGGLGQAFADPGTPLGALRVSVGEPGFYYALAYCVVMVIFGIRRVRRRRTRYVTAQTVTLMAIQLVPLFLLPYLLLPWMGNNGLFDGGVLGRLADELFPVVTYGHGREYWRAFGFILAWPLFFWNVFTDQPIWGWLLISAVQTLVFIPLIVRRWGKGAYCGWICSCGGLAETLGDAHRHKMPHGPKWNRLNMLGQVFLGLAALLLITRVLSWAWPESVFGGCYEAVLHGVPALNYVWFVDLLWAGIIGFGCYWHFSGRVWCRFACPLAALLHICARFSLFRILADKKKCMSCNVCTSVCHQGIDVMNFANKGLPMEDPECVRCSACVQMCPTGVLTFGRIDRKTGDASSTDPQWLAASPVQVTESCGATR